MNEFRNIFITTRSPRDPHAFCLRVYRVVLIIWTKKDIEEGVPIKALGPKTGPKFEKLKESFRTATFTFYYYFMRTHQVLPDL